MTGTYVQWGVISISLTNLLIIIGMIVVFVLAILLPFPGGKSDTTAERHDVPEQRSRP
ncbi:MAG: hypothetical protein ACXVXC_12460 [Nocardioidaceae bacterium]